MVLPFSPPEIVVTGTGEIMVKPDIAYLSLGIVSRDKNAAGASTANATRTQAVMDSLKKAGIAEEYLRTEGYNLRADYTYTRDTQVFKGYVVSNAVRVTVRNVANVGKVLDAAVQSGANSVGQVRFDIADASKASDAALQKAIADATRQAKVAAKSANVSRIGLTQVMVGGNTPRSDGYDNDAGDLSALSLRQRRPVFQAGQQSVAVTVTATFPTVLRCAGFDTIEGTVKMMNTRYRLASLAACALGVSCFVAAPMPAAHAQTETATVAASEIIVTGTGEVDGQARHRLHFARRRVA